MELTTTIYSSEFKEQCISIMTGTWDFNVYFEKLKKHNLVNRLFFEAAVLNENYNEVIVDEEGTESAHARRRARAAAVAADSAAAAKKRARPRVPSQRARTPGRGSASAR